MLKQRLETIKSEKEKLILEAKQTDEAIPVEVEAEEVSNIPLAPNPLDTVESCIKQIEFCKYMDGEGHLLTNNLAWVNLKNLILNK